MTLINSPEIEKEDPIANLKDLRDNYSNEIPAIIMHGPDKSDFKVRKTWWIGVFNALLAAIDEKLISPDLIDETKNFMERHSIQSSDFGKRLTTAKDIAEANALIDKILDSQK